MARRAQNTLPTIRTRPRLERQNLPKLRRLHRRRPRTDAPNLTQPDHVGNTVQPAMEQNRPRTPPSLQSRKLDRDLKNPQANTTIRCGNRATNPSTSGDIATAPRIVLSLNLYTGSHRPIGFRGQYCGERRV